MDCAERQYHRMTFDVEERLRILAGQFLALPDTKYVRGLLSSDIASDGEPPDELMRQFIDAHRGHDVRDVLTALLKDRTILLRGLSENGPRPPYESVYTRRSPQESCDAVLAFYREDLIKPDEAASEPSDHIGVELSFALHLVEKMNRAEEGERNRCGELLERFLDEHLEGFARGVSSEMAVHAQTDYYRAIAAMLDECMNAVRAALRV